ncbi:UPF0658 Golgi apparatus membrane protein C23H3.04 [Stemphylium lycopersici]|uniref:UPF0658 Golgi apparatus membrane protein C23H3.04 n=1 Tax=Stemphylium lycopersici TaxID=183478 RepID=A0A364MUF3_STELY|nr:hypothetical protein TW65_06591 [Stemphylium lycopersici]RAR01065.1 UPF0658 Golgi apparatus membrane protein C23H3.04 [Stemphylium lycopersici]RAR03884.1 UPF0658 Golgi apparatus membrane protein C23H3.04 [Stemphylium lycopersici]
MYMPNTRWTWAFMLTAIAQALIALALESYVFGKFQHEIHFAAAGAGANETRTIPTFLAVFMFGYIYQLFLVWDALRLKNTIQVIGLVLYNVGILVYAGIQFDQIKDAADDLNESAFLTPEFWLDVKPMLIALPCLMAFATLLFAFEAWKLYDEFAWTIYKRISADTRLKKRYLTYQIYIALLKFDFFFFLAFTVQFLVVVKNTKDVEQALTAVALIITFFLLFAAAWWVRRESFAGMIGIIIVYFIAMGYFLFKLIRMYVADALRQEDYKPARKSLTAFAILTILLLIFTIVTACLCTHNFNKGLKPHVNDKIVSNDKPYSTEMPALSGPAPSRMEID